MTLWKRFKRWFRKKFLGYVDPGVYIEEIPCPPVINLKEERVLGIVGLSPDIPAYFGKIYTGDCKVHGRTSFLPPNKNGDSYCAWCFYEASRKKK